MMKCPNNKKSLFQVLKKHGWYIFLLTISSAYIFRYRYDIFQMTELNAQNLVFILWLILLGLPLFSEIEIGSVKLKKEIEQTRTEVKESIGELKYQILDMKIANTNSNTLVFTNQPLPSKEEMDELTQHQTQDEHDNSVQSENNADFNIPESSLYLFKVKLSIEQQLRKLFNMLQSGESKSFQSMVRTLANHEILDRKTIDLIQKVNSIAIRGTHGEIVNEYYLQFVQKTYPTIKRALEEAYTLYSSYAEFCECPRCHYRGPSRFSNVCPKCGFTSDDY